MKKKEYIILAVVIVLLGGYLLLRNTNRSRYELPALESVAENEITRVEITASGETVTLSRSGDAWQIGDKAYPADAAKISDMLSELEALKLTALVSETGAFSPYDLSDDKKIGVRAWAADRLVRNFSIGKTANTYQHTFVRLGETPEVYHAEGSFRQAFDQSVDSLRDKTALSFTAADITGIDIVSNGKQLSLSLEAPSEGAAPASDEETGKTDTEAAKPAWVTGNGIPADDSSVQRLLSQLAYLNCSGYLEGQAKEDFGSPATTITLKGPEAYTLMLFEKGASGTDCPGISSQNAYPFTLGETAFNRLTETLDALLSMETGADAAQPEPGSAI